MGSQALDEVDVDGRVVPTYRRGPAGVSASSFLLNFCAVGFSWRSQRRTFVDHMMLREKGLL